MSGLPLLPLTGRPIISYTLDALALAGIREVLVVAGYRESQVRDALAEGNPALAISFASNPRFEGGASLSLAAAREACGDEPFLLLMADHVLSGALVRRLMRTFAADPGYTMWLLTAAPAIWSSPTRRRSWRWPPMAAAA